MTQAVDENAISDVTSRKPDASLSLRDALRRAQHDKQKAYYTNSS
jgi:hypothetical protein